jgi:hypothetical protein
MLVLVQHAAEAVTSVDGQVCEAVRFGDRFGQRCQWPGVRDALMWTVLVIEDLELTQRVHQVALVPDQRCGCRKLIRASGLAFRVSIQSSGASRLNAFRNRTSRLEHAQL